MCFMDFDESLKVGNTVIDHEHQNLIRYINVLQQSIEVGADTSVIASVLDGLTEYAATHFMVEEELMKAYDYPEFSEHLNAHGKFKRRLEELISAFSQNQAEVAESLLDFLMNWLTLHINKIDRKLASFLGENGMK